MSDLPAGWAGAQLGELGSEIRGSVKPGPGSTYELYSVPTFPTGTPEILDGADIGSSKRPVLPGDVLLCKINPRINRVWQVAEPLDANNVQIASTEYLVLSVPDATLARYLVWYLRAPAFREWIKLSVEGATGSHTRAKSRPVLGRATPVPPLNEQRRIVAAIEEQLSRLDAADASLATARRRIGPLARGARSVAVARGEVRAVGDLLDRIEAGKSFRCHGRPADPEEWGVIKVSAMSWGSFDEGENKAVISNDRVDSRYEIGEGDLLLSRANTTELVGASILVRTTRPRLLLSDKSMRLHPRDTVDKVWLQLALSAPEARRQMSAVATGTKDSMRNISQEKVKAIRLRVPPLSEQRRIVQEVEERLSAIDALRAAIERAQRRSAALRRAVLERAFRGELVPQDPSDEPAEALLARIRTAKDKQTVTRRGK